MIPLRELYAEEPVATVGPFKLKAVRETFVKRGLCRSTINKHIGTIKRISSGAPKMNWCRRQSFMHFKP